MTTFTDLVQGTEDANWAFVGFAREQGIAVKLGNNDPWGIAPEDMKTERVEFNETFVQTLNLLGVQMEPSLEQVKERFDTDRTDASSLEQVELPEVTVTFVEGGNSFKGTVGIGILSKLLSLWIDLGKLKQVHPQKNDR